MNRAWEWLKRLWTLPTWQATRNLWIFVVGLSLPLALFTEQHWLALLDAFLAGFGTAAIGYTKMLAVAFESVKRLRQANDELSQLNQALFENKIAIIEEQSRDIKRPTIN